MVWTHSINSFHPNISSYIYFASYVLRLGSAISVLVKMGPSPFRALIMDLGDVFFSYSTPTNSSIKPSQLKAVFSSPTWHEYECGRTSTSHAKGSEPFCSEQMPGILLEQGLSDALAIPDICSAPESRSSTEGLLQNSPAIRHMEVSLSAY